MDSDQVTDEATSLPGPLDRTCFRRRDSSIALRWNVRLAELKADSDRLNRIVRIEVAPAADYSLRPRAAGNRGPECLIDPIVMVDDEVMHGLERGALPGLHRGQVRIFRISTMLVRREPVDRFKRLAEGHRIHHGTALVDENLTGSANPLRLEVPVLRSGGKANL